MRDRIDVNLLGNTATQNILRYLNAEDRKYNKKRKEKGTLAAMKSTIQLELEAPLLFAQFISILPVYGVMNPDYRKLRFERNSWKVYYSSGMILLTTFLSMLVINRYIRERGIMYRSLGNPLSIRDIIFFGSVLFISVSFLKLARQWKEFVGKWAAVQNEMNNFESSNVQKKITILTRCLIFSSIFEHLLANTQFLINSDENADLLRAFFEDGIISAVIGFSYWHAPLFFLGNFLIALIWNYNDIFLSAISLSLANMFKQFNKDLRKTARTVSIENAFLYWRKKRELYNRLSQLTKSIEDTVSAFVLISFGVNLYFMCIQLLKSIQPFSSLLRVAYFCGSFGHILFRTCSVCFTATSINEHSKGSLSTLYSVPTEHFNVELQRLINQVSNETLALTGCKFFTVTRTLMLTIAGTIVTYEVVLLQFNGSP